MSPASWEDDGRPDEFDTLGNPPVNRLDVTRPGEPVAWAEVVRLGFAALAGTGWVVVPSDTVNIIITAATAVISIVATVLARRRVTPVR